MNASSRSFVAPLIKLIVFLVVTAGATYVLGATIANTGYGSTETYRADFSDVSGLQAGDDVRIAGVRVGTVSGIEIVEHDTAQVTFTVEKSRPLPTSAVADVRYRNLIGQRYLEIGPGPGDTNGVLRPGGVIPNSQTHPAVDLTVLFAGFKPLFQGLDATSINKLSREIIAALQGEGGSIELLFGTLGDLTNSLADKDHLIGEVIDNLTRVLTTVGNRDTELSDLIVELNRFVSGLAEDRSTIGNAIDGIDDLTTTTAGLLAKVRGPLQHDVVELTGLVGNLNEHGSEVTHFVTQLAPTIGALIRTASYGSWFNFYLCSLSATITLPGGATYSPAVLPSGQPRCTS